MPRTSIIDRTVTGVDAETFFALACGSDTYAACHGGNHPGGMLDVRVGDWTAVQGPGADAGAVAAALKAANAALAAASKKGGFRPAKKGGGSDAAVVPCADQPLDPALPAVRALAYRMPPDWGDGWLTKLAPAMNIEEGHVRRATLRELDIETRIKWSRLAPAAVVMRYTMRICPTTTPAPAPAAGRPSSRVSYSAVVDTADLPLPPPIRAVIETSMEASFQALVAKFIAFAADALGGRVVDGGAPACELPAPGAPEAPNPLAVSPRAAASPRFLAPPPPPPLSPLSPSLSAPASWAAFNPARHWRLVDTEGAEYWDAAEALTPRDADAVWNAPTSLVSQGSLGVA